MRWRDELVMNLPSASLPRWNLEMNITLRTDGRARRPEVKSGQRLIGGLPNRDLGIIVLDLEVVVGRFVGVARQITGDSSSRPK